MDRELTSLGRIVHAQAGWRLVPYVFEGFALHALVEERWRSKRAAGQFYTPPDVAEFMVRSALGEGAEKSHSVLDPTCGAGAFLVSAYWEVLRNGAEPEGARAALYGSDLEPSAVLSSVFSILLQDDSIGPLEFATQYARLRNQIRVADIRDFASGLWVSKDLRAPGRLAVVANPPYVRFGGERTTGLSVYRAIVDLVVSVELDVASACVILPLSVSTENSPQMRALRRRLASDGSWDLAFFDRSPDSLFGDAVKTRHVLATYRKTALPKLRTTRLLRWASTGRGRLFSNLEYTDVSGIDATAGIPKLGSELERRVWDALASKRKGSIRLLEAGDGSDESPTVHVGDTAYNWLAVYKELPTHAERVNARWKLRCDSEEQAFATVALFSSDLVFWLWLASGDGFHVTSRFIRELPLDVKDLSNRTYVRFTEAGTRYWACAGGRPQMKTNAGVMVARYQFDGCLDLLRDADLALCEELGFGSELADLLRRRRFEVKTAGRAA